MVRNKKTLKKRVQLEGAFSSLRTGRFFERKYHTVLFVFWLKNVERFLLRACFGVEVWRNVRVVFIEHNELHFK